MGFVLRMMVMTAALMLAGCATTHPKDPLEHFNRVMFNFNDAMDRVAVKPAAEAYSSLPILVQTGVGNFFGNLADPWTGVNNVLQGKVADGLNDFMRFAVNTTFGFAGLWDIGSDAGLPKHSEDLGQTFGRWGVKSGPYVVLPILGSSTLRDVVALPVDIEADPWHHVRPAHTRNTGSILRAVDLRASVLDASNLIEEAALDRYEFVRDAYLQRRQSRVYDGEPPSSAYEFDVGPTSGDSGGESVSAEIDREPTATSVVKTEQKGTAAVSATGAEKEARQ